MTSKVKKELDAICDVIKKTVSVDCIYLFGSYAYGVPTADSDYDICVIVPDGDSRTIDIAIDIRRALYSIQTTPIDLLVYHSSKFKVKQEFATFEKRIAREGVLLYKRTEYWSISKQSPRHLSWIFVVFGSRIQLN